MSSASKTASDTASNTAAFVIFHRDNKGKPDRIFSYEDEEAKYLLVGVNICRELLKHNKVRGGLADIAKIFKYTNPSCLFKKTEPARVAERFIKFIFDTFPWFFVDDGFLNPNISACHHRRKYDRFFTRNQGICLNGSNFRDLCAAAKKAKESKNQNSKEHQQYRIFIFDLAITLFHELAHVYITFLSLGGSSTPEEMTPEMHGIHARDHPEAGNSLEGMIFGGSLVLAPENDGKTRPGVPHLVMKDKVGRISQQTVDEFVQCKFKFPIEASGPAVSDPLKPFGEGYVTKLPDDPLDPARWPETRKLAEGHPSNPFDFAELDKLHPSTSVREKIQVGTGSVLARMAFQPSLKVVKVPDKGTGKMA